MPIRLAFTGTGYASKLHAQAAQKLADVELAAVVNQRPESMGAFARQFGIPGQYNTVGELLDSGEADALVISTPNVLHAPEAVAALRAGVHVMVEKPMAMNAIEAEQMVAESQRSGALLMVAHNWRFDQDVLWLKAHLEPIMPVVRTKSYALHVNYGPEGWFNRLEQAGGGALADLGVHALDTTRYLLDDPLPARVYARTGTYYKDIEVEDTGEMLVSWQDGSASYIEAGWWQPHSERPLAATQLYGKHGYASLFPTRVLIGQVGDEFPELIDPEFPFPRSQHAPQSMYDDQLAYFIECVQTGRKPTPGGEEGLINMRIIDGAYGSARTGRVVEL